MKKIIASSFLSLGIIFLAGCGQQQASQSQTLVANQSKNTNTEVQQPTDIANWLTYQSTDYRFNIKYPKDWSVKSPASSIKGIELNLPTEPGSIIGITYHENLAEIKPNYATLKDYIMSLDTKTYQIQSIKVNGMDAFEVNYDTSVASIKIIQSEIFIEHNKYIYVINYTKDQNTQHETVKRQIINTLTFTN